jgi:hypothetical protein
METLYSELESAMEAEITPKVLDILVEIAEIALIQGDKNFAIEILALTLNYPMRVETLERAECMFSALEAELCPRVMWDAYEKAQRMTLEDMVAHVLEEAAE